MYLEKFVIRNFRTIEKLELNFNKGLNVIVGENNSGKTAIIDALRLCLGDFQQPRDIYCNKNDFRVDKSRITDANEDIRFDLVFKCEDKRETAWFNSLHALNDNGVHNLQLHFRYELIDYKASQKIKRTVWGGANEGRKVPQEVLSELRNVYLSALRNPNRELRPVKGNILGDLYSNIIPNDEVNQERKLKLLKKVTDVLNDDDWKKFIEDGNKNILEHIKFLTYLTDEKRLNVEIGFSPFEFNKFLQNLIILLPVYPENLINQVEFQHYFEIFQNGLGYNNIIYTAVVLGDIKQRNAASMEEFTLLLIEEPESHLHPQLQNIFFNFLKRLNDNNDTQIIVTSHSPIITAKTDINLLIVLQNSGNKIISTQIKDLNLEEESLKYLQKFLDVTKSQLFFSNGVILVEGISESLLIPIFSRILGKEFDVEHNGVEVVNINGVAFKHFARLFNSKYENKLMCRCVIITDDDEGKDGAEERIEKIKDIEGGNLISKFAKKTFEYELFIYNHDNPCLLEIIEILHPIKINEINNFDIEVTDRADIFVETLSTNRTKSEFAYLLAMELENQENYCNFVVPPYIEEAIKFVVNGDILKVNLDVLTWISN